MTNYKGQFFTAARVADVAIDVYVVCDPRLADLPANMGSDATCKLSFTKPGLSLHVETTGLRGRFLLDGKSYHNVAVAWSAVFLMQRADGRHLVDWRALPESVCGGMTLAETKAAYVRMLGEHAQFYGAVSLGDQTAFGQSPVQDARPESTNKRLPNGWRVIAGGAE